MHGHLSFGVSNLDRAIAFYDAALAPLGFTRVWTKTDAAGYGLGRGDVLALKKRSAAAPPGSDSIWPSTRHLTRRLMPSIQQPWQQVEPTMALPVCARTMPAYYAAFVIDPDGYPIEAVCQQSAT